MKSASLFLSFLLSAVLIAQDNNLLNKANRMNGETAEIQANPIMLKVDAATSDSLTNGLIEIKDEQIDLLIQDYADNKKLMGYRIQIFSGSVRANGKKVRIQFRKKFPEEKSYELYQVPNFKVRVGNYRDRLKVQENLEKIKVEFPSAFVVKCEIEVEMDDE